MKKQALKGWKGGDRRNKKGKYKKIEKGGNDIIQRRHYV